MDSNALIDEYIGRLRAAAGRLTVDRCAELVDEVREHISAALAEVGQRDEATVRNILERLGQPEDIVAAEAEPDGPAPAWATAPKTPAVALDRWGGVEVVALLLLTVGAVLLPFVGPLLGLVFVWLSTRWTPRQKAIATAIVVILLVLPVVLLFAARAGFQSG